jgi:hypothetical protein
MSEISSVAETMLEEISKIVGTVHPASTADATPSAPPTITAALSAIMPSVAHVAQARRQGIEPAAHLAVVRQHIADTVQVLQQFIAHTPANDPNVAKVKELIGRFV